MKTQKPTVFCSVIILLSLSSLTFAQWNWTPTPNDTLVSYRILPDYRINFKIYAPKAEKVLLGGTDIPGVNNTGEMSKMDNGVWYITVGPVEPGSYRYNFNVDGVFVLDPKNPLTSESNMNSWSLLHIKGSDFMDTKNVPHGAISEIYYFSKSLQRFRRMHIYTPPDYESGKGKYPVLYLLHGAFDCDDSWSTVGRAGFILDNLIAAKKAKPMIVVMPAGHTAPFTFGGPRRSSDEFVKDFTEDIKPLIEKNYRILSDRKNHAIAGLSMGGMQTLNIAIPNLEDFAYIGVYSSGVIGIAGGQGFGSESGTEWEGDHAKYLDNAEFKKGLELVWFATGKEDFLLETSRMTVDMLKKHGFDVVYKESEGGHTWINWRDYLHEFAQLLF
jgi:enterochelin esterase-like enzyme